MPYTLLYEGIKITSWCKKSRISVITTLEDTTSLLVFDLPEVARLHEDWTRRFSSIRPYFAMKCNPDPEVIRLLWGMGVGFDCASKHELQTVLDMGATPGDIIYANTCKLPTDLRYAGVHGVTRMTADSVEEIHKIGEYCEAAHIILRIYVQNNDAVIPFGDKFGALEDEWPAILDAIARYPKLSVAGVSFHVGSGCSNPSAYRTAIDKAKACLMLMWKRGLKPTVLDIGGGFSYPISDKVADIINDAIDGLDITVIAEPGRYFVETAVTLHTRVIGKRARAGGHMAYWINESIYGCFADVVHGYLTPDPRAFLVDPCIPTIIYGATCDGSDIICKEAHLPELELGDWIAFPNMGAYTVVLATGFNGMGFDAIERRYIGLIAPRDD